MLPILPLRLIFSAPTDLRLPRYPGSLWRSALGATLRHNVCVTGAPTCNACPLIARCAYGYLFDTPQAMLGEQGLAQYKQVSHPYILSPLPAGVERLQADEAGVDLILIGPAPRFLPELFSTLKNLRLGCSSVHLKRIALLPVQASDATVVQTTVTRALEARPQIPQPPPAPSTVRITFEHPLRLRRDNHYLDAHNFDFGTFFTSLMRRISMLYALANPQPLTADFASLAQAARQLHLAHSQLSWYDWHRKSARQGGKPIPMGGIVGQLELHGELAAIWPWLWVGQWLHAGKGAVMGMGRYYLEYPQ